MNILNITSKADLLKAVFWQYDGAQRLKSLISQKQNWTDENLTQFWQNWYKDVFNIDTANTFGLNVWGLILQFPRQVASKSGDTTTLNDEQYRLLLKGQVLKFKSGGTVSEINEYLKAVFGNLGDIYILDNYDMSITLFMNFEPPNWLLWLLKNVDFIPRPAGVELKYNIIPENTFSFNGNGLETFNHGVFYHNYNAEAQDIENKIQFTINAPANAEVSLNGVLLPYQTNYGYFGTVNKNAAYTLTVTRAGYQPFTQSGTATQNLTFNIYDYQLRVHPASSTLYIDGVAVETASTENYIYRGFYTDKNSLTVNYEASATGYGTKSGAQVLTVSNPNALITLLQDDYLWQIDNIRTDNGSAIQDIDNWICPSAGTYKITLNGEGGLFNNTRNNTYTAGGGKVSFELNLQANQVLNFKKINGGFTDFVNFTGGCGIACYVDNILTAVSGGGGMAANYNNNWTAAGGGGYKYGAAGDASDSAKFYKGQSISGQVYNYSDVTSNAYGGSIAVSTGVWGTFAVYGGGGSGFAVENIQNAEYEPAANYGDGQITIKTV